MTCHKRRVTININENVKMQFRTRRLCVCVCAVCGCAGRRVGGWCGAVCCVYNVSILSLH